MVCQKKKRLRRQRLMEEHGGRCVYCGLALTADPRHFLHDNYATLDHVVPRSRGGAGLPNNRTLACRRCNEGKGDMLPWELEAYRRPPAMPPRTGARDLLLDSAAPAGDSRGEADPHGHTHGAA